MVDHPKAETALVVQPGHAASAIDRMAFEPHSFAEAKELVATLWKSKLLPRNVESPEAALIILIQGREHGFSVMQSFRWIYVVKGRTGYAAQGMLALVLRSGLARYCTCVESTDTSATWETWREGAPKAERRTFTIEQAKRAGLLEPSKSGEPSNWHKYPSTMLCWRAAANLMRQVYPDVVGGLYMPEELSQMPAERRARAEDRRAAEARDVTPRRRMRDPPDELPPELPEPAHAVLAEARESNPSEPPPPTDDVATGPAVPERRAQDPLGQYKRELYDLVGRDRDEASKLWREHVEHHPPAQREYHAKGLIARMKRDSETPWEGEVPPLETPEPKPDAKPCEACKGYGRVTCTTCDGKRKLPCECTGPNGGRLYDGANCPGCKGAKEVNCPACMVKTGHLQWESIGTVLCKGCQPDLQQPLPLAREPGADG